MLATTVSTCYKRLPTATQALCTLPATLLSILDTKHQQHCTNKLQVIKQTHRYLPLIKQLTCVQNMSSSVKISPATEISVDIIKPEERQQILDFLHVHYYREEPLTAGSEPPQPDKEDEEFNLSNIRHGTCIKAVLNENGQQKIVGALLAGPKGDDEADHIFQEAKRLGPTKWGRILHFLAGIERDADIYKRFNAKNVLHVHVIGVDNEVRGKNVGHRMLEQLRETAKSLNYDMLSADCTSFYSARLFERFGFQCINKKYYRDYVNENGEQVFRPKPPHECVQTFALRID